MSKQVLLGFSLLLIFLSSCSKYRKLKKSDDWQAKYDGALAYYDKGKYYKAATLFEDIIPIIRGLEEGEIASFYYAYSHYHQQMYTLSSHLFKQFYDNYNRSERAKEALYMYAFSLYLESPRYNLDQSSTYEAREGMQYFINKFPYDSLKEDATVIIDELQVKLEKKFFENAKIFHKLGRYKSAIIALENFQKDFPDSDLVEDAAFYQVESAYKYAKKSVDDKKVERYNTALDYYFIFIDRYEESEYSKDAQGIYTSTLEEIEKIKSEEL